MQAGGRGFDSPQLHDVRKCPLSWLFTPANEGVGFPTLSSKALTRANADEMNGGRSRGGRGLHNSPVLAWSVSRSTSRLSSDGIGVRDAR
ncbi:MAG: hypothetical protein RLZZ623_1961 [Actinomycetota bacterium]